MPPAPAFLTHSTEVTEVTEPYTNLHGVSRDDVPTAPTPIFRVPSKDFVSIGWFDPNRRPQKPGCVRCKILLVQKNTGSTRGFHQQGESMGQTETTFSLINCI